MSTCVRIWIPLTRPPTPHALTPHVPKSDQPRPCHPRRPTEVVYMASTAALQVDLHSLPRPAPLPIGLGFV